MNNCETGAFSRMANACQKCPDRDICQNKRMEAMAYIIPEPKEVTINMSMPTMEEINRQISDKIAKSMNICGFGELRR